MTYFMQSGNVFHVATKESMALQESLPVGTYTVKQNPMTGEYFIQTVEGFSIPDRIYGETVEQAERVLKTFADRPASTGIMLNGVAGSGKTLMAKTLSVLGAKQGIPTIVINNAHAGEDFNAFLQQIEQPIIMLFDEFEKVYDSDKQEMLLTLFDGVYPSKKLFIITTNNQYRIDEHMRNRPGRFYYSLDYEGLSVEFVTEYSQENLKDTSHIPGIVRIALMFDTFNFDMLKALIEEMNRYDQSPQEALKMLNAKPNGQSKTRHKVSASVGGVDITPRLEREHWTGNPLMSPVMIDYIKPSADLAAARAEYDPDAWDDFMVQPGDLKQFDPVVGTYAFETFDGVKLLLTRVAEPKNEWYTF